jgi:hypothetical protein
MQRMRITTYKFIMTNNQEQTSVSAEKLKSNKEKLEYRAKAATPISSSKISQTNESRITSIFFGKVVTFFRWLFGYILPLYLIIGTMCVIALPKGALDSIFHNPSSVPVTSKDNTRATPSFVPAPQPTNGTNATILPSQANEVKITDIARMAIDSTKERVDMIKESHDKLFSLIAALGALLVFFGFKGLETFNATRKRAEDTVQQAEDAVDNANNARELAEKSVESFQNFVEHRYAKDNSAEINVSQGLVLREIAGLYKQIMDQVGGQDGTSVAHNYCAYLRQSLYYLDLVTDKPEGIDNKIVVRAFIIKGNVFKRLGQLDSALKMVQMAEIRNDDVQDYAASYNASCYSCLLAVQSACQSDHKATAEYEAKAISYLRTAITMKEDARGDAKDDPDFEHFRKNSHASFLSLISGNT